MKALATTVRSESRTAVSKPGNAAGMILLITLGIAAAVYVGGVPAPRPGLDLLWLLPASFSLAVGLFGRIIPYHRGGVGLKVMYLIILVRYILSPVLITASSGELPLLAVPASADGYNFAVVAMMAELLVYCAVIRAFWQKRLSALEVRHTALRDHMPAPVDGVTLGGLLLTSALLLVVASRGLTSLQSSMGFLLLTEKYEEIPVDSYAIIAVQAIKSFLFVGIAVACQRRYRARGGVWWFVIAACAALLNVSVYFGYNRSLVLQTAIATFVTMAFLFPRQRAATAAFLVPIAAGILYSMITLKQFATSVNNGPVQGQTTASISGVIETYVGGPWPLATAFDAASSIPSPVGLLTIARTYTDNIFVFKIPGLTWPNDVLAGVPSIIDLYQAHTWPALGAMLPLGGEMWFYGGDLLGPFLILLSPALISRLLVECEARARMSMTAQNVFVFTWLAALLGLAMCYCSTTLVWSISKFALFLALMFWVNNRIVLRKGGNTS